MLAWPTQQRSLYPFTLHLGIALLQGRGQNYMMDHVLGMQKAPDENFSILS